jgi:hypothetical protein
MLPHAIMVMSGNRKHLSDPAHYISQVILCSGINFVGSICEEVLKNSGGQVLLN